MTASYFPHPEDSEILLISDRQPCRAEILSMAEDGHSADLLVTDHLGGTHRRQHTPIGLCAWSDYCILV